MIKEKQIAKESEHGQVLAGWAFPEFVRQERSLAWYAVMSIIGIALIIYAIVAGNYLFALIIVLIAFIILIYNIKEPMKINFQITEDGIMLASRFYEFKDINNFWIIYEPPAVKTLYFEFKSVLRPKLSVPLAGENPLGIREILLARLPEDLEKESESNTDALEKLLKL